MDNDNEKETTGKAPVDELVRQYAYKIVFHCACIFGKKETEFDEPVWLEKCGFHAKLLRDQTESA